jgi:hypothetical protein
LGGQTSLPTILSAVALAEEEALAKAGRGGGKEKSAGLRSEVVTLFKYGGFFASKLIVFSVAFCQKSKKSQPLSMMSAGRDLAALH